MNFADYLLGGAGSDSDWLLADGAGYVANQDPMDALDTGTGTYQANATGGATATTSPPGWLTALTTIAGVAGNSASTFAPLVNGQPSGATPGATTPAVRATTMLGSLFSSPVILLALVGAALAFFFLRRKR